MSGKNPPHIGGLTHDDIQQRVRELVILAGDLRNSVDMVHRNSTWEALNDVVKKCGAVMAQSIVEQKMEEL